jgi:hypothetical protein
MVNCGRGLSLQKHHEVDWEYTAMDRIDRRHFLGATAGVAACFGATNRLLAKEPAAQAVATDPTSAATNERPPVPPTIELGKTGIKMSRLGQGTGVKGFNRQSDQTHLGFEKLVALMHHAYDRGITFFDLADLYGTHVYFRTTSKSTRMKEGGRVVGTRPPGIARCSYKSCGVKMGNHEERFVSGGLSERCRQSATKVYGAFCRR